MAQVQSLVGEQKKKEQQKKKQPKIPYSKLSVLREDEHQNT